MRAHIESIYGYSAHMDGEQLVEAFRGWVNPRPWEALEGPEDSLGPGILAAETRNELRANSSDLSKRWRILTPIQVEDFKNALRESHVLGKPH